LSEVENEKPEQPPVGGFCETCGHFAARHDEKRCHFPRPADKDPCDCPSMRWLGVEWPMPWDPEGYAK
jgi:hypothetical protein